MAVFAEQVASPVVRPSAAVDRQDHVIASRAKRGSGGGSKPLF